MNDSVDISEAAFEQYRGVQETGQVNMMNIEGVKHVADSLGYYELAEVIEDGEYDTLIENYDLLKARYE